MMSCHVACIALMRPVATDVGGRFMVSASVCWECVFSRMAEPITDSHGMKLMWSLRWHFTNKSITWVQWTTHKMFCSSAVLDPRVGHAHHGRTFSISLCPLSFWLTLPQGVLCPSRPCVVFLACVHLALFLASLSPGNSLVSEWRDHSMVASLLWLKKSNTFGEVANQRHLANTTEWFVLGGVAALSCYHVSVQVACTLLSLFGRRQSVWERLLVRLKDIRSRFETSQFFRHHEVHAFH